MTSALKFGGGTLAIVLVSACGGGRSSAIDAADAGDVTSIDGGWQDRDGDGSGNAVDGGVDTPIPGGYSLPEFPGGESFYIRLPPSFSPFLPLSGDEATREPPGFYQPTAEAYFSYAFIWWLTGTPDLSTTGLRNGLRDYYTGLCGNIAAVTLGESSGSPVAQRLVARRDGTLDVGACFGNPVPAATVEVSTYDCPDHAAVIVLVSPQPQASQVWTNLRALRDGFTCW